MDRIVTSFCRDCEWTARTDTVADRSGAVVEHHVSTGHTIDSVSCAATSEHTAADLSDFGQ
jgi:hypothetical protein